jgi:antitoxin ParD1/3/4
MPTQNVNLSDQQAKFIHKGIKGGRYRNASEVVRAGLRLLEQQDEMDRLKLDALRRVAKDAFQSIDRGEHVTVSLDRLGDFMDRVDARARTAKRA